MNPPVRLTLSSPDQMMDAGRRMAGLLAGGELISLVGPLGAGKTQFVKGLARGLEVPERDGIISPTFVLMREYSGRLRLNHIDLYRLRGAEELENIGWHELRRDSGAVMAVEWADRVPSLTSDSDWTLEFKHLGPTERSLDIACRSSSIDLQSVFANQAP